MRGGADRDGAEGGQAQPWRTEGRRGGRRRAGGRQEVGVVGWGEEARQGVDGGAVGDGRGEPGVEGQRRRERGAGTRGQTGHREVLVELTRLDLLLAPPLGATVLEPHLEGKKEDN